jgi:hypothetical protein
MMQETDAVIGELRKEIEILKPPANFSEGVQR